MASTCRVACVSVKDGRVFAPGHGLIAGCRVALDDVRGCEHLKGETFLATGAIVCNHVTCLGVLKPSKEQTCSCLLVPQTMVQAMSCSDDHFTLGVDVELQVSSAEVVEDEDGVVSVVTSQPHLCDVRDPPDESLHVVLRGFGELDAVSFEAYAVGDSELHLVDFFYSSDFGWENQGKVSVLQDWLSRHPLTGAERILLPDRAVTDVTGTLNPKPLNHYPCF